MRKKYTLRYFVLGEYGDHTRRPHYHAVLFSNDVIERQVVHSTWNLGLIRMDSLNPGRAAYVAKYHATPDDTVKEFRMMSTNPGLGTGYVIDADGNVKDDERYQWHRKHTDNGYIRIQGIKYNIPRFIKKKIYSSDELREAYENRPLDPKGMDKVEFDFKEYSRYLEKKRHDMIRKRKGIL